MIYDYIINVDVYLYNNYNIIMEEIKFEWDENALVINDPEHSQEDRFIILGVSDKTNLLVVCHCYRESDSVIRIISARKATTTETKQYNNF